MNFNCKIMNYNYKIKVLIKIKCFKKFNLIIKLNKTIQMKIIFLRKKKKLNKIKLIILLKIFIIQNRKKKKIMI